MKGRACFIWDLDGTLFNIDHRLPLIKPGEKQPDGSFKPNWQKFHSQTKFDVPYPGAYKLYQATMLSVPHVILTGRSEIARLDTVEQMDTHGLDYALLLMRPTDNYMKSAELKNVQLGLLRARGYNPILAFEDQPDVVQMYREQGLEVFAANDSNWRTGAYGEVSTK